LSKVASSEIRQPQVGRLRSARLAQTCQLAGMGEDRTRTLEAGFSRERGVHLSTLKFSMSRDLPKGEYNLLVSISGGGHMKSVVRSLLVQ
jgi:hypothetical protein